MVSPMVYVKLVACMMLWGGTFVTGRILAQDIPPTSASFLRFLLAAALLMMVGARMDPAMLRPTKRQLAMFTLLGLTGVFAYNIFFLSGLKTVAAGRGAIIIATNPVITGCLAALLFKEALGGLRAVGVGVSLMGVLTVVTRGDLLSILTGVSPGDLLMCGAVCSWSAYSLAGKKAMQRATPIAAVGWSAAIGSLLLFPAALADGLVADIGRMAPVHWACIIYMGAAATSMAFLWFYQGIKTIGAVRAAAFINLVPVFASCFGYLILDETLAWSTVAGGALVLFGVWLTNRPQRKPAACPASITQE